MKLTTTTFVSVDGVIRVRAHLRARSVTRCPKLSLRHNETSTQPWIWRYPQAP